VFDLFSFNLQENKSLGITYTTQWWQSKWQSVREYGRTLWKFGNRR